LVQSILNSALKRYGMTPVIRNRLAPVTLREGE
jgi:hypothetical protein